MKTNNISIRRQKRQSMMMRAVPGGVEVFIPNWMNPNHPKVQEFIRDGIPRLEQFIRPTPLEQTSPQTIHALVDQWAPRIGVRPQRVQIRTMYNKWGSCSNRGNITFNRALCWLPLPLAEYVVVHELVHLIEFNHGVGFQQLMTTHLSDWRTREQTLNQEYSTYGTVC